MALRVAHKNSSRAASPRPHRLAARMLYLLQSDVCGVGYVGRSSWCWCRRWSQRDYSGNQSDRSQQTYRPDPAAAPAHSTSQTRRGEATLDPHPLFDALNAVRPDPEHVYDIHEINLRRSSIDITLIEGKLAFLAPINGLITGAVFTGRAHIIATPRDAAERRSLVNFVGVPLIDQAFSRAYLRFTDDTAEELLRGFAAAGITAQADEDFAEDWNSTVGNLNSSHSLRIMTDLLSDDPQPYFSAALAGSQVGPFDVLVDRRREEPVLIGSVRSAPGGPIYEVWASFAAPDAPPVRESVLPVDYRLDTTIGDDLALAGDDHMHLKGARTGDRVIAVELSRLLSVDSVTAEGGPPLAFFHNEDLSRQELSQRGNDLVYIVLAHPIKQDEELRLAIRYHGSVIGDAGNGVYFVGDRGSWYPHALGMGHFASFDMTFHWPRRLTLVATGTPSDLPEEGGRRSGRWVSSSPMSVVGFNLGEYVKETAGTANPVVEIYANKQIEEAILDRLHDRAAAYVPNIEESPEGTRGPPLLGGFSSGNLPPNPAAVLKHLGAQILDSIHFYEGINGLFSVRSSRRFSHSRQFRAGMARANLSVHVRVSAARDAGGSRAEKRRAR